ncbi:MAG: single-stranded DNA-binding protein [Saprospiraceae bacterium]|jgi:single-strand DNA-binding protein|nr:single-stranded DNA-binding protein [Saprospiraceae bacterium]MBK8297663.1 single-stranded DNA-binding protein [Saprospiraceae bacterium]
MLNKVTLIGNLGKDPEIRALENGVNRANFTLATNENYKDRNGNWQKSTEWHEIIMWRSMAERAKILKKGMLVYVEGKLTHRKWVDKEGRDHYTTEITADVLKILEKRDHSASTHSNPNTSTEEKKYDSTTTNHLDSEEDDLPF